MRRYFSNFSPVEFGIDVVRFRNFNIINKSGPLPKHLLPLFLSGPDSWRNTAFAFTCQSAFGWKKQTF